MRLRRQASRRRVCLLLFTYSAVLTLLLLLHSNQLLTGIECMAAYGLWFSDAKRLVTARSELR